MIKQGVILMIRGYKLLISPLLPRACRFYPTCSEYAMEAIARFGVLRGGWLAIRRIGRCHPFHPGVLIRFPLIRINLQRDPVVIADSP